MRNVPKVVEFLKCSSGYRILSSHFSSLSLIPSLPVISQSSRNTSNAKQTTCRMSDILLSPLVYMIFTMSSLCAVQIVNGILPCNNLGWVECSTTLTLGCWRQNVGPILTAFLSLSLVWSGYFSPKRGCSKILHWLPTRKIQGLMFWPDSFSPNYISLIFTRFFFLHITWWLVPQSTWSKCFGTHIQHHPFVWRGNFPIKVLAIFWALFLLLFQFYFTLNLILFVSKNPIKIFGTLGQCLLRKMLLALMGVLTHGSAQDWPSAPIDTSNYSARTKKVKSVHAVYKLQSEQFMNIQEHMPI
jgi:hypothetical protein